MAFNAYDAVKMISDLKTGWHSSFNAGDKAKADEYANKAKEYYKQLRDNGYKDVADALANTNDVGAKYIVDTFIKNNSAPATPTSSMPESTDTSTVTGKINHTYDTQVTNMADMKKKYDFLENYNVNYNPYEDEIGKSIMEDYKFKGKTASDNAVASGGAANGGNIDSYAAANANRQQLAFTNAGKQAVLNDFNTRVSNYKDILNNLGVYLQGQEKGMQTTIGLQQSEEQRKFDNDVTTSEVTGYVPESMSYSNNPFFNKDGSLINPETTDYSQIITNARNKLKTTTDSAERANLEATIKNALQARAYKILNVPGYSKYADTMELTSPDETLTSKLSNKELDNEKTISDNQLATQKDIAKAELDAQERMNDADNATNLTIADKELSAAAAKPTTTNSPKLDDDNLGVDLLGGGDVSAFEVDYQAKLDEVYGYSDKTVKDYIRNKLEPLITENSITETELKEHLVANSEEYDLETKDIKAICEALGVDAKWVDDYKDSGLFGWGNGIKKDN